MRTPSTTDRTCSIFAGLATALVTSLGVAACGHDANGRSPAIKNPGMSTHAAPTPSAETKPPHSGTNDAKFRHWIDGHEDAPVTVTGHVKTVLTENAFTLAGEHGADELLVVSEDKITNLKAGDSVAVEGAVHKAFNLPVVQDKFHVNFNDPTPFQGFDRDPYIQAMNTAIA